MPYNIFFFDEGFTDDDLIDPRSDQEYDPDDPDEIDCYFVWASLEPVIRSLEEELGVTNE